MTGPLNDLERRIAQAQKPEQASQEAAHRRDAENMSVGMRAGTELVASIAVGGLVGWWFDGWLQTKPIFLIVFLLLGIAAGFVNVWRVTQGIGVAVGYAQLHKSEKQAKETPDISDDDNE